MAEQVIKIFCPAEPYCKEFRNKQFKTIGQFQLQLKQWFQIQPKSQILIKDGIKLDIGSTNPFSLLNLNPQSRLMVVSLPQETKEKESQMSRKLKGIKQTKVLLMIRNQIRQKQLQMMEKMCFIPSKSSINQLVRQFVKMIALPKAELLLINTNKLDFIIHELTKDNNGLRRVLLGSMCTVKQALINQQQLRTHFQIKQSTSEEQIAELVQLCYEREQAISALQIAKNNIQQAIETLYYGNSNKTKSQVVVKKQSLEEEYLSIYGWLSKEEKKQIIMLYYVPSYMNVYLNSVKDANPSIFKLMTKWYSFLHNIVQYMQPKLPQDNDSHSY